MVCTFGRGRMSCIARLLEAGSFPEKSAEEATHERIAIQTIYRQFCDADEPNLLEEKDMHVFDSRPLRDPLHLVCCNDCGKPVKASQFAAHAERCRSINSKEDAVLELDAGTDRKKPTKKGRRIQATNDQGWEKPKSEPAGGDNVAASEVNLDNQNGMHHTLSGKSQKPMVMGARLSARDGVESMGVTGGCIKGYKKKRTKRFGNSKPSSGSNLNYLGLPRGVACGRGCDGGLHEGCSEYAEQQGHSKNARGALRHMSSRKARVWKWADWPGYAEQQRHSKNAREALRHTSSRKPTVWKWANLPGQV